jgi:hypothetical protein
VADDTQTDVPTAVSVPAREYSARTEHAIDGYKVITTYSIRRHASRTSTFAGATAGLVQKTSVCDPSDLSPLLTKTDFWEQQSELTTIGSLSHNKIPVAAWKGNGTSGTGNP